MKIENLNQKLKKYEECLFDIKMRIDVIAEHFNKYYIEKYKIVEDEFLCLQFRKIIEKIAMLSLVANKEEYEKINSKFSKDHNPRLILRDLKRINKNFYPVPTIRKIVGTNKDGTTINIMEEIKNGFLTENDLIKIYEKCSGLLHATNPYSTHTDLDELEKTFTTWLSKIKLLINHHIITLCDGTIIVAILERSDNAMPQAVLFSSVNQNN